MSPYPRRIPPLPPDDPERPASADDVFRRPAAPPPFRLGYVSVPRIPLGAESRQVLPDQFLRAAYPKDRVWVHVLLLVPTLLTTTLVGSAPLPGLADRFPRGTFPLPPLASGLWYSLTILAILGAHEFGPLLRLRALPGECVAALLPAAAVDPHRNAGRVHQDPAAHPDQARSCSTSASPARWPVSSSPSLR